VGKHTIAAYGMTENNERVKSDEITFSVVGYKEDSSN